MYANFKNLPEEKRKRIIDISIEEFAHNGYEKASTNEMVKKAGISKGILFHYFGNKKNLFLYVMDYTIDYMVNKVYTLEDTPPADVFDRLMYRGVVKMKMAQEDPLMYEMIYNVFVNTPEELKKEIKERYDKLLAENAARFIQGADTSSFRKDIDHQKAISLIFMFLEAYTNKYIELLKNSTSEQALVMVEKLRAEIQEYFDILKRGIYEDKSI